MENRVLFRDIRVNGYHGTKAGLKIWFGKHKHKASHPYHRRWISKKLRQAIKSIKGHDVF